MLYEGIIVYRDRLKPDKNRDVFTIVDRAVILWKRGPNGKIQRTTKLFNKIMKCLLYVEIKVRLIIQKETNYYLLKSQLY